MDATNSHDLSKNSVLNDLRTLLPNVEFRPGAEFSWSPEQMLINYNLALLSTNEGMWSLLHEVGHAKLNHQSYATDFDLLTIEVKAWDQAKKLARLMNIRLDDDHVQNCLDTYRDWLHRRSTCPTCGTVGLQHTPKEYRCHNCNSTWVVTAARFCRPYRRKFDTAEKSAKMRDQAPVKFI